MLRSVLLGKMVVAVIVSLVVVAVCVSKATRSSEWTAALAWLGSGAFFLLLALGLVLAAATMLRRPDRESRIKMAIKKVKGKR